MNCESVNISYDYIKERIYKFIDAFNVAEDDDKRDEIYWELEVLLDFLNGAGIGVKLYENYEGDQWEFGYIYKW